MKDGFAVIQPIAIPYNIPQLASTTGARFARFEYVTDATDWKAPRIPCGILCEVFIERRIFVFGVVRDSFSNDELSGFDLKTWHDLVPDGSAEPFFKKILDEIGSSSITDNPQDTVSFGVLKMLSGRFPVYSALRMLGFEDIPRRVLLRNKLTEIDLLIDAQNPLDPLIEYVADDPFLTQEV